MGSRANWWLKYSSHAISSLAAAGATATSDAGAADEGIAADAWCWCGEYERCIFVPYIARPDSKRYQIVQEV